MSRTSWTERQLEIELNPFNIVTISQRCTHNYNEREWILHSELEIQCRQEKDKCRFTKKTFDYDNIFVIHKMATCKLSFKLHISKCYNSRFDNYFALFEAKFLRDASKEKQNVGLEGQVVEIKSL